MLKRTTQTFSSTLLLCAVTNLCYATGPGFYLGAMFGPANNGGSTQQLLVKGTTYTTPGTPKGQQFASRLYAGYQINNYAGWELGLNFFSDIHYDTKGIQTCSASTRVRDIDFLGKALFNFGTWFDIYAKAGIAVVYQTTSAAFHPGKTPGTCGRSTYTTGFKPAFSVGASYNLNQSWLVDISANRLQTSGAAGNFTWYALGISYHFVDVYCGQFLCE